MKLPKLKLSYFVNTLLLLIKCFIITIVCYYAIIGLLTELLILDDFIETVDLVDLKDYLKCWFINNKLDLFIPIFIVVMIYHLFNKVSDYYINTLNYY